MSHPKNPQAACGKRLRGLEFESGRCQCAYQQVRVHPENSLARECSQTGFAILNDFHRTESFASGISITFSFTASPIQFRNSRLVPATPIG